MSGCLKGSLVFTYLAVNAMANAVLCLVLEDWE